MSFFLNPHYSNFLLLAAASSKKDEDLPSNFIPVDSNDPPPQIFPAIIPIIKDPEVRKKLEENNATFDGTQLNFAVPEIHHPQSKNDEKGIIQTVADLVASAFTPLKSAFGQTKPSDEVIFNL